MYNWFTADQLGELFKLWERIPFLHVQGSTPPPLRIQSSNPSHPSLALNSSTPHPSVHPMTATLSQLRLLLAKFKKLEGFSDLSQQQQQEVLVQRCVHLEQQRQQLLQTSIPNNETAEDLQISSLKALSNLRIQSSRPPVQQMVAKGGHVHSIWDITRLSEISKKCNAKNRKSKNSKKGERLSKRSRTERNSWNNRKTFSTERSLRKESVNSKNCRRSWKRRLRNQELLRKQEEEKRRREEEERMRIEEDRIRNDRVAEEQKRRHEELMRLEECARLSSIEEEDRRRQIEVEKETKLLLFKPMDFKTCFFENTNLAFDCI